ncbi:MAG: TrkH family potassium uptake protein [Bacteroidales bacterium]|nr:TrkH family potassium uptake protein [Bacteroidales bacterium]
MKEVRIKRKNPNIKMFASLFRVMGILLVMESLFMLVCTSASFVAHQYLAVKSMLTGAGITLFAGILMWLPFRKRSLEIDKRTGFLIVTLIWIIFSFFGALPAYIGGYIPSFIDAYFETMSGFTTTGSSVLNDVESLPYSVGLWRVMTQWIGGIGIIVIMLSVIPFVGGGGMALFSAEVAGITKSKIAPHIRETSKALLIVYISLTLIYFFTYYLLGMSLYDAVCHAFTTVATAGLSSKNASAAAFAPQIQYAMTGFMLLSGTNILFIYSAAKGDFKEIRKSEELRVYYSVVLICVILIFLMTFSKSGNIEQTLRNSLFMVSSVITSTGLINCEYSLWPIGAVLILIMLMNSGAMSGSTTGGLKLVRMMVLFKNARNTISRGLHSNAFIPVTLNGKMLQDETIFNVFNMFMLYVISLVVGSLILVATGIGLEESVISSITSLCNMGPGFGMSAYGNFSHFSPFAKVLMAFMMCAGRLELITVYSVFSKSFWKR